MDADAGILQQVTAVGRSVPGGVANGYRDRDPDYEVMCDPVATAPDTDFMPSPDCLWRIETHSAVTLDYPLFGPGS